MGWLGIRQNLSEITTVDIVQTESFMEIHNAKKIPLAPGDTSCCFAD